MSDELAPAMLFIVRTAVTLLGPLAVYAWATTAFAWFTRRPRRKRGLAAALLVLVGADRLCDLMIVHWHSEDAGVLHTGFVLLFTTFVLAALPVALLKLATWAVASIAGRLTRARADATPHASSRPPAPSNAPPADPSERRPPETESPAMTRRQWVEAVGGAALFGATGSMLGWGMVRGRHAFELTEVPLRIPGLPRVLDGYVIAQVSDIHAGAFVGERELDEGLSLVRAARPDLIVVTGDLVDFDPAFAPVTARKLADLSARDGVAAILGNHDYYAGADAVIATLGGAGIDVLRDSGRQIRKADGGGFALLGVDDLASKKHGRRGPNLARALATVPADLPRILLSHQPSTVDEWAGTVAVQLSGHTHGGQINPGFSPVGLLLKYLAGSYEVNGTMLYVNRGFGTVGAPSRIGAPPEVTRFVLVAG